MKPGSLVECIQGFDGPEFKPYMISYNVKNVPMKGVLYVVDEIASCNCGCSHNLLVLQEFEKRLAWDAEHFREVLPPVSSEEILKAVEPTFEEVIDRRVKEKIVLWK